MSEKVENTKQKQQPEQAQPEIQEQQPEQTEEQSPSEAQEQQPEQAQPETQEQQPEQTEEQSPSEAQEQQPEQAQPQALVQDGEKETGPSEMKGLTLTQVLDVLKKSNLVNLDVSLKSLLEHVQNVQPDPSLEWGIIGDSGHWVLVWKKEEG